MVEIHKHFRQSIAWNALESILYQALFLGHQVLLFKTIDPATYGLISTVFSITFLLATITNFGFDASISPFFTIAIQSKQNFKNFFFMQLIPECIILLALGTAIIGNHLFFTPWITLLQPIDTTFFVIIGSLIFFEGAKKTLRMILQLAFLNHKTALVEIATIITYIGLVWTSYAMGLAINLYLALIPMLIVSILSSACLFIFVYRYYKELPDATSNQSPISLQWRILHSRFFNFLNQISHMVFSSNFLVPFFAISFGFNQAGFLKLIATIAHSISTILQKIFGISSNIVLSHLKNTTTKIKQDAFLMITNRLNQVLYGIIIFFIINHKTIIQSGEFPINGVTWIIAYLFLLVIFSENFFIAYEKLFITHERTDYLCLFNLGIMGIIFYTMTHSHHFSMSALLLIIIAIRIISFLLLGIFSYYQWRIRPSIGIQPKYLIGSLIISVAFFAAASLI